MIDDIAEQLVHGPVGQHLKVIFGGGRAKFINETKKDEHGEFGERNDGKDLIAEWLKAEKENEVRTYISNKVSFKSKQKKIRRSFEMFYYLLKFEMYTYFLLSC